MPSLRERGDDALQMARLFLSQYAREAGRPLEGFSRDAVKAIRSARWTGNVRELINRIRRAIVVATPTLVTAKDLDLEGARSRALPKLREARQLAEIQCLKAALEQSGHNRSQAARTLDISRTQLYALLQRYGLLANPDRR